MKQEGKFILMSRDELIPYINGLKNVKSFSRIQQHHTYSPDYSDVHNNQIALMKSMENYHVTTDKMSEIAQHFSTFPDGSICVGRPLTKDGGGFKSPGNKDSITLENVGNFDVETMTEEQKKSIILLNALLCKKFGITPSVTSLPYHTWFANKSCPGVKFFGGNTKEAAEKYFIPLIKSAIEDLSPKPVSKPVAKPVVKPAPVPVQKQSWKDDSINYLYHEGIVSDAKGWIEKEEEAIPVWAATIIIANLFKKVKNVTAPASKDWKQSGIDLLYDNKLLSDKEGWTAKIEEHIPVWAATTMISNVLKNILPEITVSAASDWKLTSINYLHEAKVLDDVEGWSKKKDEDIPVWALCVIVTNAHKRIVGGK